VKGPEFVWVADAVSVTVLLELAEGVLDIDLVLLFVVDDVAVFVKGGVPDFFKFKLIDEEAVCVLLAVVVRVKFAVLVDELLDCEVVVIVLVTLLEEECVGVAVCVLELICDRDPVVEAVPVFEEVTEPVVVFVMKGVNDCLADLVIEADAEDVLEGFNVGVNEEEALFVFDIGGDCVFVGLEDVVFDVDTEEDTVFDEVEVFVAVAVPVLVFVLKLL
jgi:hypothetical protein